MKIFSVWTKVLVLGLIIISVGLFFSAGSAIAAEKMKFIRR
jgi:hypothetical protein